LLTNNSNYLLVRHRSADYCTSTCCRLAGLSAGTPLLTNARGSRKDHTCRPIGPDSISRDACTWPLLH